jgi:hypothetical protein
MAAVSVRFKSEMPSNRGEKRVIFVGVVGIDDNLPTDSGQRTALEAELQSFALKNWKILPLQEVTFVLQFEPAPCEAIQEEVLIQFDALVLVTLRKIHSQSYLDSTRKYPG